MQKELVLSAGYHKYSHVFRTHPYPLLWRGAQLLAGQAEGLPRQRRGGVGWFIHVTIFEKLCTKVRFDGCDWIKYAGLCRDS